MGIGFSFCVALIGQAAASAALVERPPGAVVGQENYVLDASGNRTAITTLAGTTAYTLDELNRLTGATERPGHLATHTTLRVTAPKSQRPG
jgi:hypothetical protein